ncbi:hypothetical protein XFF6991_420388 [Xanthomonas phaseoli pv. phaseoli]|uniref:Uncharacterized protein n=1 Tax=Xanthomonas campestris pv. phaseoli TaxID=317013 RepID=A0A7Z7NHU7_XANCH|nr:hypothetical protein XFF6991_420388 [Xanthomonas phaseoli pv. phaseoli]
MSLVRPGPWQRGSGFFYFGVGATDADGPQPPGSKKCSPTRVGHTRQRHGVRSCTG